MEFVYKHDLIWDNGCAVFSLESETVSVLGGLYSVDEDEFTATGFVVNIFYFLVLCAKVGNDAQKQCDEEKEPFHDMLFIDCDICLAL
jgi:hypothetical protein